MFWKAFLIISIISAAQSQDCTPWAIRLSLGNHYDTTESEQQLFITFNTNVSCPESFTTINGKDYQCSDTILENPNAKFVTWVHVCNISNLPPFETSYQDIRYYVTGKGPTGIVIRDPINFKLVNRHVKHWLSKIKEEFKVLIIGDWGLIVQNRNIYYDIIPRLRALKDNFAALVFLGDMAYDLCKVNITVGYEDNCSQYYSFLSGIEFITSKVPFMPTLGNHQYGPNLPFSQRFAMNSFMVPGNTLNNYSFEIGPLHFQTVNFFEQAKLNDTSQTEAKVKWLKQDFDSRSPEVQFVVPFSHYPFFCKQYLNDTGCRTQHYDASMKPFVQYMNSRKVLDVLNQIALYLGAHIHLYRRSFPVTASGRKGKFNLRVEGQTTVYVNPQSPVYLIEGSGGNDYYVERGYFPLEETTETQHVNTGYTILTSYPGKKQIKTEHYLGYDGSMVDSFMIRQTSTGLQYVSLGLSLLICGLGIYLGIRIVIQKNRRMQEVRASKYRKSQVSSES